MFLFVIGEHIVVNLVFAVAVPFRQSKIHHEENQPVQDASHNDRSSGLSSLKASFWIVRGWLLYPYMRKADVGGHVAYLQCIWCNICQHSSKTIYYKVEAIIQWRQPKR